jgi:hypothetical protein
MTRFEIHAYTAAEQFRLRLQLLDWRCKLTVIELRKN